MNDSKHFQCTVLLTLRHMVSHFLHFYTKYAGMCDYLQTACLILTFDLKKGWEGERGGTVMRLLHSEINLFPKHLNLKQY